MLHFHSILPSIVANRYMDLPKVMHGYIIRVEYGHKSYLPVPATHLQWDTDQIQRRAPQDTVRSPQGQFCNNPHELTANETKQEEGSRLTVPTYFLTAL